MPEPPRDPWSALAGLTPARVALGRTGAALPTARHLELQLAHARARDAVWHVLDAIALADALRADGHEVVRVRSAARDRREYLERPDLGRRLDPADAAALAARAGDWDLAFVVGDGLAALAAERHAPALVRAVRARLAGYVPNAPASDAAWRVAPVVVAEQARVALGDAIGAALGAQLVAVLLGERPGMSAPDSLGVYLTWDPRPGRTDAERNCVSNVRPEGLPYAAAAATVAWLAREARRRRQTGVALRAPSAARLTAGD
ncbi:ethanolamine ammonia-lyase light chain [Gemmatimonadetes bacterium T265]|nr:ethanolamine ammonia-lyase light chain [Gemmatimonadetes bacterium T265]